MIKGLYTSAMGMLIQESALNVSTNNLANANTLGYKKDRVTFEEFPNVQELRINDTKLGPGQKFYDAPKIGRLGTGVILDRVTTNHEQGIVKETNNRTDFALEGKAYMMVQTEQGVRFTRSGNLHIDNEGYLVTHDNHKVLGTQTNVIHHAPIMKAGEPLPHYYEPVRVEDDLNFAVNTKGEVKNSNFRIVKAVFKDTNYLQKEGISNYKLVEGVALKDDQYGIRQGFLELSNVNVVTEMTNLIRVQRAYEANSKILSGIDEKLGQTAGSLGSLR